MRPENVDFAAVLTRVASCLPVSTMGADVPGCGVVVRHWTKGPSRGPAAPGARPTAATVTSPASPAQPSLVWFCPSLDPASPAWF